MTNGSTRKFLAVVLFLLMTMTTMMTGFAADEEITITILQTTDMHGRIYAHDYAVDELDKDAGFAKIYTLIKEERAKNPNLLLIDTGDTVQDNSAELFNDRPVHPMVEAMNMMGYDLWTIGNHEFNFELDFLKKNVEAFEGTVLAANIYKKATGDRWLDGYKIFEIDGVRVAVIGMLPPHIPVWEASSPSHFEGLEFKGIVEETGKVLEEIEGQYDVLIAAYHVGPEGEHGYEGGRILAETYPQFDAVMMGHAHSKINEVVNGVQLIEPGKYGWALGKLEIKVSKAGEVLGVQATNIETYEVEPDQEILDAFADVHQVSIEDANTVVGKISNDFIERPDYITGEAKVTTLPTAQVEDTAVIDLINDVQMFYSDADISSAALFNFGSNLTGGDFMRKDVAFIYKYPNTLSGVNITGENMLKYMEWSVSYYNTYTPGDVTISFNSDIRGYNYDMFSGMTYDIDITKEAGNRIKNVLVGGEPLNMNKTYKLAVNNYRFGTLISLGLVELTDEYYNSYSLMQDAGRIRDLIIKYTVEEKEGVLTPTVDNNWKLIGADLDIPAREAVFEMVRKGEITIPTSEDGRTQNVEALNLVTLMKAGDLKSEAYKVKSGDVLWRIAYKYGITWKDAALINGLKNPHLIYVDQMLYFPVAQ
jgi:2',3'-cyclic-nucleotide 2'-phosphodiesterase/3'-nucleotidase